MNSSIQLQAVIEAPYYEGEFFCPWEVIDFQPCSTIRLFGEMSYPEIGLVFAQLAKYNQIKLADDKQVVIRKLLELAEDIRHDSRVARKVHRLFLNL